MIHRTSNKSGIYLSLLLGLIVVPGLVNGTNNGKPFVYHLVAH